MTRFLEDPTTAILISLGFLAMFVILYMQTKKSIWLGAVLGSILFGVGMFFLEQMVVTDREEVEAVIYGMSDSAKGNDVKGFLAAVDPNTTELRSYVNRYMPMVEVNNVTFTSSVQIKVDMNKKPPLAIVNFQILAHGRTRKEKQPVGVGPAPIELTLKKLNGKWLVTDIGGLDRFH